MNRLKNLQRFLPVGALGISLVLHLAIFLGISGIILIQAVAPKIVPSGDYQAAAATNDLPLPPDTPDEPDNPIPANAQEDAALEAPPVPTFSVEQISSANATAAPAFTIAPPSTLSLNSGAPAQTEAAATRTETRASSAVRTMANPFTTAATAAEGALSATFYDLKQTVEGQPSDMYGQPDLDMGGEMKTKEGPPANNRYKEVVQEFISKGWNEQVLNRYFHVSQDQRGRPLGAFQIFIPGQSAEGAPKAFGVEKKVKAKRWVIVYRGAFTAPDTGMFRFAGFCDDVMAVRLGNREVFDGSLGWNNTVAYSPDKLKELRSRIGLAVPQAGHGMFAGRWFKLESGQTYPLQVLIGECPGGLFSAFLLIEKQGEKYDDGGKYKRTVTDPKTQKPVVTEIDLGPALPVFQLAPVNLPRKGTAAGDYNPGQSGPVVSAKAFICQ